MGLAASQARLLTLTSRLHDIEYKQQQLANTDIRFSMETEEISKNYTRALDKQKFQFKNNDGDYVDMTLRALIESGKYSLVRVQDGKKVVAGGLGSSSRYSWNRSQSGVPGREEEHIPSTEQPKGRPPQLSPVWNNKNQVWLNLGSENFIQIHDNLCNGINEYYYEGDGVEIDSKYLNDANWLYEAVESGQFMLVDASGNQVNTASNTNIDSVNDRSDEAKAKAEYDAAMNKVNRKQKLLDAQMKQLDTEYQAVNTEYESVKSIISDHAQKDFELFG